MGFRSPVECAGRGEAEMILGINEIHDRIITERAEAEANERGCSTGNQASRYFLLITLTNLPA